MKGVVPKEYRVGDKVFKTSREGAEYIQCSVAVFLRRFRAYLSGDMTEEQVLHIGKLPRTKWRNYGTKEWRELGTRPRNENLNKIPPATYYDNLLCPIPDAAEGVFDHGKY